MEKNTVIEKQVKELVKNFSMLVLGAIFIILFVILSIIAPSFISNLEPGSLGQFKFLGICSGWMFSFLLAIYFFNSFEKRSKKLKQLEESLKEKEDKLTKNKKVALLIEKRALIIRNIGLVDVEVSDITEDFFTELIEYYEEKEKMVSVLENEIEVINIHLKITKEFSWKKIWLWKKTGSW